MTADHLHDQDQRPLGTVYLLHFTERLAHAAHYTGWAQDLEARLAAHAAGRGPRQGGARLVQVIRQAGIGFELARIWPGVTRARERQLKQQGGASRRCPICRDQRTRAMRCAQRTHPTYVSTVLPRLATLAQPEASRAAQRRAFLALNPEFARPAGAPVRTQWHRVRGREDVEALTPRVVTARYEENEQLSQHRAANVIRRAVAARTTARQQRIAARRAGAGERTRVLAERTRTRLDQPVPGPGPRAWPAPSSARTATATRTARLTRPARKEADRER